MNRAAGAETARLRELQRLHDDALPRERCIAVHQYRHDLVTLGVVAALLASPHRALDYRIDDLEMRGIEGERDVHVAGRGAQVGREAFVILDVAGTLPVVLVVFTLELREQLRRGFSQHIDQYVEPARCAMPSTNSSIPAPPPCWIRSFSSAISASPPSSEKRFWPDRKSVVEGNRAGL